MATPAEIIAARVNGTYVPENEPEPVKKKVEPVDKENAFPVLGGRLSPAAGNMGANTSWGPGINGKTASGAGAVAATPLLKSNSARSSPVPATKSNFKGTTVQEAFSLDVEDQLNVTKAEFIKVLSSIKQETKTSIECTTSQHTKKRTFLITGSPEAVKLGKRLVIKKLTKPVSIAFTIPSKLRSRVIGAQGKNLKPIIEENDVKINIPNAEASPSPVGDDVDDDDIFAHTVEVTVDGDAEGCKRAKALILAIVKEETKNTSVKIPLISPDKPWAAKEAKIFQEKYPDIEILAPLYNEPSDNMIITGERELVLKVRDEINEAFRTRIHSNTSSAESVPRVKQQFLPIQRLIDEDDVFIELYPSGDIVKFIGPEHKLNAAKEKARQTTLQYQVDVLDMSKAHKGNINHVKAIASLFLRTGKFKEIAAIHNVVVLPPKEDFLTKEEEKSLEIQVILKTLEAEAGKDARRAIVSAVNRILPEKTKVVDDVDVLLLSKAESILKVEAPKHNVEFTIFRNKIYLFDVFDAQDSDDFGEDNFSDNNLELVNNHLDELRGILEFLTNVVMTVSVENQRLLNSKNSTLLNLILNEVEPESVMVEFYSDGIEKEAYEKDSLLIHGIKDSVLVIEKHIAQVLDDYAEHNRHYLASVEIPASVVPKFIGKAGANVNAIKKKYGVDIDSNDFKKEKLDIVNFDISGHKKSVELAKSHIQKEVKKLADDKIARVRVEAEYHRRLAGPGFKYMHRLEDKYGVKIRFPGDNIGKFVDAPSNKDEITIRGPSKGVAKAEEEIKELYAFEKENGFKTRVKVPTKAIARVIGRNGDTIKGIVDGFGVDYSFNRNKEAEEAQGFGEIEFTGSRSALKQATEKVNEIIEEVENFVTVTVNVPPKYHSDIIGPAGRVMREIINKAAGDIFLPPQQFGRLLQVPDTDAGSDEVVCAGDKKVVDKIVAQIKEIVAEREAAIEDTIEVPKSKHRQLVGPGGAIRKELQEQFGVRISLPRPENPLLVITLSGKPERIEKLKERIKELTKNDWNESIEIPAHLHVFVSERGTLINEFKVEQNVNMSHGNYTRKATLIAKAALPTPPEDVDADEGEEGKYQCVITPFQHVEKYTIPWRFSGDKDATAKAAKVVEERLEQAKNITHQGWFTPVNSKRFYPRLIGSQGSNIKQLRKETGAFIMTRRDNGPIYIAGTEEQVKAAKEAMTKLV